MRSRRTITRRCPPSCSAPCVTPRWLATSVELGLGRAILDSRPIHASGAGGVASVGRQKPAVPLNCTPTTDKLLVRFVGHPELARNTTWIGEWAVRLHAWLDQGRDVYFFAHCPVEEVSPFLLRELQRALVARGAPIEPLPLEELDREAQADLFK